MKIMNLLTDDMLAAIDVIEMPKTDRIMITSILYQERQNKERTWDSDAEKYITKLIDEDSTEASAE